MRKLSPVKKLVLALTVGVLATGSLTACLPSVDKADAKPSATSSAVGAKKPGSAASPDSKEALTKNIEIGKIDVESNMDEFARKNFTHVRFPVKNKNKTFVDVRYTLTFTSNAKSDSYGERQTETVTVTDMTPPAWKSDYYFLQMSFCTYLFSGETCNVDLEIHIPDSYYEANGTDIDPCNSSFTNVEVSVQATEMLDSDLWFDCTDGLTSHPTALDYSQDWYTEEPAWIMDTGYSFTNNTKHYIKELHFRDNYGTYDASETREENPLTGFSSKVFQKRIDYSAHYAPSSDKDAHNELSGPYKGATSTKAGWVNNHYDHKNSLHFAPGEVRSAFSVDMRSQFLQKDLPFPEHTVYSHPEITPDWISWQQSHWKKRAYCLIDATKE